MYHNDLAGPKHFSGWKKIKKSTYKMLLEQHKQQPYLSAEQVAQYQAIVGPEKKKRGDKKKGEEKTNVKLPAETLAELKKLGIDWKE